MSDPLKWPFETWLRLAVLQMGFTPDTFWETDVIDWLVLCKKAKKPTMSLSDFETLQKQFPDSEAPHD